MPRKLRNDLTQEDLRGRIIYLSGSGKFYNAITGYEVGNNKRGIYSYIEVRGRKYLAHRLAWLYVYGQWPHSLIDHIDGNPRNNEISNLREATDVENHQNTKCRGFHFCRRNQKYRAQITIEKQRRYLGYFDTPEQARAAYEAASQQHFGKFSGVARGMK